MATKKTRKTKPTAAQIDPDILHVARTSDKGEYCVACGARVKTETHKLCWKDYKYLTNLNNLCKGNNEYFSNRDILMTGPSALKASPDSVNMRHWGLIEKRGKDAYRMTSTGVQFVKGTIKVKASCERYHNEPVGLVGKLVSFNSIKNVGRKKKK
jgi:hypothetical protein